MKITVLSGKGGTGKTTISTNLSWILSEKMKVQLLDTDVEEPNTHLFFNIEFQEEIPVNIMIPVVDKDKCILCGECAKVCQFGAIAVFPKAVMVFENLCHGCGACSLICPTKAIDEKPKRIGVIRLGRINGNLLYGMGLMDLGEPSGVGIIRELKKRMDDSADVVIIDAPPGTSCPVVESLRGTDFAILVTESSPFGLHDLRMAVEVVRTMEIPMGVVLNKYDSSFREMDEYIEREGLKVLMRIPFDKKIAYHYSKGELFTKYISGWRDKFWRMYEEIKEMIG